ncbi:hypothetical protein ABZ636_37625 [Streptomyces sp. NPDC007251]|uniref:hypothetical protein n=1 Tax=Streptomyces sp. NPDC007251 TaxID=3154483 RepID=UPI0033F6011D
MSWSRWCKPVVAGVFPVVTDAAAALAAGIAPPRRRPGGCGDGGDRDHRHHRGYEAGVESLDVDLAVAQPMSVAPVEQKSALMACFGLDKAHLPRRPASHCPSTTTAAQRPASRSSTAFPTWDAAPYAGGYPNCIASWGGSVPTEDSEAVRVPMLAPIAGERIVHGLRAGESDEGKHLDARQDWAARQDGARLGPAGAFPVRGPVRTDHRDRVPVADTNHVLKVEDDWCGGAWTQW